MVDSDVFICAA